MASRGKLIKTKLWLLNLAVVEEKYYFPHFSTVSVPGTLSGRWQVFTILKKNEKSYISWIWVVIWQFICFSSGCDHIEKICWVMGGINSESAKIQNTLIKELKTLSCPKLSGRCTLRPNWYSGSFLFSLFSLVSFGESYCENTNCSNGPTCSLCRKYPCCVQETFLADTCKIEADTWFS